ncbi:hypothetical protein ABVK25_005842 [Lepraria finkii]|uniref:Clustered mitochondria protein N-terminal domain-containing protein n=1 Tax=Lepraria finkii TaxID=1340010 RepID=A0ABR4B903_9LECA
MSESNNDAATKLEDPIPSKNEDKPFQEPSTAMVNGEVTVPANGEAKEEQTADNVFQVNVKLPHHPYQIQIMVSTQEQVQDLRQSIMDSPGTFQYSCFHLEHNDTRINDFIELSEVKGWGAGSELKMI